MAAIENGEYILIIWPKVGLWGSIESHSMSFWNFTIRNPNLGASAFLHLVFHNFTILHELDTLTHFLEGGAPPPPSLPPSSYTPIVQNGQRRPICKVSHVWKYKLTLEINSLPKVTPETISIKNVCRTIQNTIIKMADGGHFEFWALTNSAHTFTRVTPAKCLI